MMMKNEKKKKKEEKKKKVEIKGNGCKSNVIFFGSFDLVGQRSTRIYPCWQFEAGYKKKAMTQKI